MENADQKIKAEPKYLTRAVDAWRRYMGSESLPLKTQQKLYNRAKMATAVVCRRIQAIDCAVVENQIVNVAERRGRILPLPGKDY